MPDRADADVQGVWSDAPQLVVDLRQYSFADRCLATHQPTDGTRTSVLLRRLSVAPLTGEGIHDSIRGQVASV